ncbi:transforming growth factor-beta-induced protein ig-h3-like, partial [Elysia marginata]
PNMCKVQHVVGSKEKFYTYCVAKHIKYICERPTYVRWECCSGFTQKGNERGCTNVVPLNNLLDLTSDLKLDQFVLHAKKAGLQENLTQHGPFTVFAPSNEAFTSLSVKDLSSLHPGDGSPSLMQYHVIPGRLNISLARKKNQEYVTLYQGKKLRFNKYSFGVATVNCARIMKPDEMATNGIVHVIDKVIRPVDMHSTIAQQLQDDERFSNFGMALLVSKLHKRLKNEKRSFTVLAPTNEAFAKLPTHVLDKIFSDSDTAEKIMKRHIIRGVFCADAIVVAVGLRTIDADRMLFRCKRDGLSINQAKVVYPDIVKGNGVIHGIDTVLLPDSVKNLTELMTDMQLSGFLNLMEQAGLNVTIGKGNVTLFAPTDKALKELDPQYMAELKQKPEKMVQLVNHHVVPGKVQKPDLLGDHDLPSMSDLGIMLKVNVDRQGVRVDKAKVGRHPRECKSALIHRVDNVLVPPEASLMETVVTDPDLSMFSELMAISGVSEILLPDGHYTLLAPTNKAFKFINKNQLEDIMADNERLEKFVERHVITRMVLKCTVPWNGVYTMKAMQSDKTHFAYGRRGALHVNTHARVLSEDILTSNGVLYKIDHVLPCSCERGLRNKYNQYISSYRYRKPYW